MGREPSAPVPARLQPPLRRPSRPLAAANAAAAAAAAAAGRLPGRWPGPSRAEPLRRSPTPRRAPRWLPLPCAPSPSRCRRQDPAGRQARDEPTTAPASECHAADIGARWTAESRDSPFWKAVLLRREGSWKGHRRDKGAPLLNNLFSLFIWSGLTGSFTHENEKKVKSSFDPWGRTRSRNERRWTARRRRQRRKYFSLPSILEIRSYRRRSGPRATSTAAAVRQ